VCNRLGRNLLNLNSKSEHKVRKLLIKVKKNWSHEMCNHYYQNEIDKVRAELENIRTSDVSASTTLAFFNHS